MIKEGDIVEIVSSRSLDEMRISGLAGMKGVVTLVCDENKTPGAFVHLCSKYMDEYDWYVPMSSMLNGQMIDARKREELINQIQL